MRTFFTLLLVVMFSACNLTENTDSVKLQQLFDDYIEYQLQINPILASINGDHRYNDQFHNYITDDFIKNELESNNTFLERLAGINTSNLSNAELVNFYSLQKQLELAKSSFKYPWHLMPIGGLYSPTSLFPAMASAKVLQPFNSTKDYYNFLKRLDGYISFLDTSISNMKKGIELNVVQPKVSVEHLIPMLEGSINDSIEISPFYYSIYALPDSIPDLEKKGIKQAYYSKIKNELNPAYSRLVDFMKNDYLPHCRESIGYYDLPNGKDMYQWLISFNTSKDLTPAYIFELGKKQVKETHIEMARMKNEIGFDGDLKSFFDFLRTDDQFYFKESDSIITAYYDIGQIVDDKLNDLFTIRPKAELEIRKMEDFRAPYSHAAEMMPGSSDGSRKSIFYINTYKPSERPKYIMRSLYIHEAVPGHYFQMTIQNESPEVPKFRKLSYYNNAFIEGWALYSEELGKDMGLYENPYDYIGHLTEDLWRSIRLVVDVGIHYYGWTKDQVIDYMMENTPVNQLDAEAETYRYIGTPSQALSYKIGEESIKKIRQMAEDQLGVHFDIKGFHDKILLTGAIPLEVFESEMERWIDNEKEKQ